MFVEKEEQLKKKITDLNKQVLDLKKEIDRILAKSSSNEINMKNNYENQMLQILN